MSVCDSGRSVVYFDSVLEPSTRKRTVRRSHEGKPEMLLEHQMLIDQVRRIAASLNDTERLALIRAIASLEPPKQEKTSGGGVTEALLDAEQQAWFARPLADRLRYAGHFVAVRNAQVVDHDPDQRTLFLRVRERFAHQPVLIIWAEWSAPPEFVIHSPRLAH